uniref:SCO-spondin-like isoform X5 n=1 Tax=Crassostrea virginica TaxID=6565 RepID=A0A8B8EU12_CRAVI|nr:SCO-spondin-like isoform X5 [Crassostrea virginica]
MACFSGGLLLCLLIICSWSLADGTTSKTTGHRCYVCSYGKKNSDCTKIEECKKDEGSCETKVHRDKTEITKICKKTKDCKTRCDANAVECHFCCTGDLCNKDQGYAEYQAWGQWSACSEQCGGGKRKRERACTSNSIPCSGGSKEEETCNTQACTNSNTLTSSTSKTTGHRCYVCSYGKKNSDCSKIEECKKDEGSCETMVHRDKTEITKKCKKTKDCKTRCDANAVECHFCCTGDLCNKDQGYAEYQTWGQWSACSEQCGGGKRKRERACTSNSIPCSGDNKEEETCNTQACTNSNTLTSSTSKTTGHRCYVCSYGKKNSDCSKIEECKKDEGSCETMVHRDKTEITKKCKKTKDCKTRCDANAVECHFCCTGDLCNKDQGYAEYQAWGQWSACSEQCGGGKRKRERACTSNSIPCSGGSKEEETCNTQACTNSNTLTSSTSKTTGHRCYVCSYGKKNSDCSKIEECKKDEGSCETMVHRDKTEITKKCKKTKDCKTRCDANAVECHFCCTGDLCNKDQGYAEYQAWGQWSACSEQCGGGKRKRERACTSNSIPCSGGSKEEETCNTQACTNSNTLTSSTSKTAGHRCYVCSYGKKNSDCSKIEECKKDEGSCETMVHRDKTEITKKCKKTKDCKTRCDANAVECHFCCTGDLCNKDQGYAEYQAWGQWSACSEQCGGGKRKRERVCTSNSIPCSGGSKEEETCNTQACTNSNTLTSSTSKTTVHRCYVCSYGKKNSDCSKIEECKKDEESCETKVHRDKTEITKKCKKTKDCKTRCDANAVECHFCCTGDLCNKDQGYAEYQAWGQWSACSEQCGGGKRKRERVCTSNSIPCSGVSKEEETCNTQACAKNLMRCYTCDGKKNSDCTKYEVCKKDEESCETKIKRNGSEIKKKCKQTKDCKATCKKNEKDCTLCCVGDLCNKDQGYAEFKTWGAWSTCSKQCGGGKRSRSRECASTDEIPCTDDTTEEEDCNTQSCPLNVMRCYTCDGKKNSDCTKYETCKKDEESCETNIKRNGSEIKKKCKKTKYCKAKCSKNEKDCTLCCVGDLCNKDQGYAEFKTWGTWSTCSKQCGGGKRSRSRECASTDEIPCTDDTTEEVDCNTQSCPQNVMRCYTCDGKKNSDCTKYETCKKDEESCETNIKRNGSEIKKKCKKTKDCKAKCSKNEKDCTLCCVGDLCNKDQGYAEFKTWGAWSTCSKQCGGGKRSRSRECASTDEIPCTDDTTEEEDCNTQSCPQNVMRCYTCDGKKNSDCTKYETCKKDEESCETNIKRNGSEIKKKCKKTKDCKAKCSKNEKDCTLCCVGDLCNKDQGYAEFKTWGAWSTCSKQCGGGKRSRSRECASTDEIPCTDDTTEEVDCNTQSCPQNVMRCYTCDGKKNSDCTKYETCKKDEESCETNIKRNGSEIKKKCKKTKDCKAKCSKNEKDCTLCCVGDLCNKDQGYAEFKTWGAWSTCSKQCGGGKRSRSRECASTDEIPCTDDTTEEVDCNTQSCPQNVMRCYTCDGKKNSDCTKYETCKKDEESCETNIKRNGSEIKKKCKKTKDCKAKCSKNEKDCTLCCVGDLCNKDQGYAEFKTWGAWSTCSKQCGGGKRSRSRECASTDEIPCTDDTTEEVDCNTQSCPQNVMRCYTCDGKKNSDCTKYETCKKDEESCETNIKRNGSEIKKKCKKTKDCKAKCSKNEKDCTLCCVGDLCNKDQGYAEFKTWGAWSTCSKQCGGGKRSRSRECASTDEIPCTDDTTEEVDCNTQSCPQNVMRCYTCDGKKNSDCTKYETCKKDEESCETNIKRNGSEIKKKCKKTKDCKAKCSTNEKDCTLCCVGDLCNKDQGYAEFKTWGAWSTCSKQCGGGKRSRSRECASTDEIPCTDDTTEEEDCNTQSCPQNVMRCYTCDGKKNSDCTKYETCKKDEESCETNIKRNGSEIKKKCKKTKDCKAKCSKNEKDCILCCVGDLCNKDQGYAEFKTWGAWSTCSKQCGGGKRSRSRECASTDEIPCTDDTTEDEDCNTQSCPQNVMRCYTCDGKKNSDCTKYETCKKDEESCETNIKRNGSEIKKKCKKTKDCKAKCSKNEKDCTLCCVGDLCNKDQGYAEFKTWGAWSTCSKQCGGGKRSRSRECASTDEIPCTDATTEEEDCNTQSCPQNVMRCYTCDGKKNSDCTKYETCKKDEESCETNIKRNGSEIKKKCKKTKDCKAKCSKNEKDCTLCCVGDLCNKDQGYAEFKTWGAWSTCSKQCGGGKRSRSRECASTDEIPCTDDTTEEVDCNTQSCPQNVMRCYTCDGKKNSDCTKYETCKKDEESCETNIKRNGSEIKKKCKKTKDCKAKCSTNEKDCTLCCVGDLCNKDQGYAEFKTWGAWSTCSKQCGGGKRRRSRECASTNEIPCTDDTTEEVDCNTQSCPQNVMRCYTCDGKKNSDCTKYETCKKDEESCETSIKRNGSEIKKKCKKTKDCKAKCSKNEKDCTLCCVGDLCNKDQGYAEFKTWGAWSTCSKQCGGGKRSRNRECASTDEIPCTDDTTEDEDCNTAPCTKQMKCFSCGMSNSNKDCNKQRGAVSCQAGQNACGVMIDRKSKKVLKTCASACSPRCDSKTCTFCCNTPNCNEEYGTYSPWSNWQQETVNKVDKLKRKRTCTSGECSSDLEEIKDCTPSLCKVATTAPTTTKPAKFGCFTCSNANSNEECTKKGKYETCLSGQICGTRIDKNTKKIIKACTPVCNAKCDSRACVYCCSTPGCNDKFGTLGPWSAWKQETENNVEVLVRSRTCLSQMCSGETKETKACTPGLCSAPAQKCFVCNNGKKNSDCTKIETCKKDEESCETKVYKKENKITKKCKKTKDCKTKCDPNDDNCVKCCTGQLCNKDDGYAEWSVWGPWTVCSKQCGGGIKRRKRACSTTSMPCSGLDEEEMDCNSQPCATTTVSAPTTVAFNSSQFGCYICSHEKNNGQCNNNGIKSCPNGQRMCGTRIDRSSKTVMKACAAACKPGCNSRACTFCCTSTGCNKEFGTYTPWSSWKEEAVKGVKMLKRTRFCTSDECSEETTETKACTPLLCSGYVQQCYVCKNGKKNSDCSQIETCKKDEDSCETRVEKNKAQITKRCGKESNCKAKCDAKDTFCVSCCKGSLCNKDEGYGTYETWGQWTSCSKRCGGGKQNRARKCSSSTMPCDGAATEERSCNIAACAQSSECQRCVNAKNNGECNKQRRETCAADQSCETKIDRRTKALTKKCTPSSSCKSLCQGNSAICTFCCQGDNCNEDYGVWTPWSAWSMTTGKKARSRTCDTVECSGEGIEEEACTGTACTGVQNFQCRSCANALTNTECSFGSFDSCPADKQTCKTTVERATGRISKGCSAPTSCSPSCTIGSQTCVFCCSGSKCNENYGTWAMWGAWTVTGTKGSMMTRTRTCSSVECSGQGVETIPCSGPICKQFRCQLCNNATSNEACNKNGFQTCSSNEDTCGTTVERASKRITKGCKPKGGCKPWCDGISCTFCCNSAYCNDVYGVWQLWTSWKVVLVNNVYKRQRVRSCATTECAGEAVEEEPCSGSLCTGGVKPPIDGGFTDWAAWSTCTKTCGGGTSQRLRSCSQPIPEHGGKNCTGDFSESKVCNTQACAVDGNWGTWGPWTTCTKSCGGGKQHRERKCDDPAPAHGGTNCTGNTNQLDDCNDILCPLPSSGKYVNKCPPGWFTCKSGGITCIDISFKCDCSNDCDDGSDEEISYASCQISQVANCKSAAGHVMISWWITMITLAVGLLMGSLPLS